MDQSRREKEMERLNKCYSEIVSKKSDMQSCLSHMISTESYRLLDGWSYSLNPECIRDGTTTLEFPDVTDVNIYFSIISSSTYFFFREFAHVKNE